ncbi:MAG: rsmG [Gammaproteobacteria bacterium]|jgi:16S rRNA (guanine527-N7)-methyltransferase|nr:rsmG [Gammaproteobacteria bacterium]
MINNIFDYSSFLHRMLVDNQYNLSSRIEEQFIHYLHLLTQWNKVFNLTSICLPEEMILLHIVDSLSIHLYLHGNRIIDVGTGAGLPGIPLALLYPAKKFFLIDSNNKKTRFIIQAIHELKLENVEVIHSRCENFHPKQLFDSVLSRAFASLQVMLEATQHLVNENGLFLAMKGTYPKQEIQELSQPFKLLAVHKLTIHGLNAERHLICLAKEDG